MRGSREVEREESEEEEGESREQVGKKDPESSEGDRRPGTHHFLNDRLGLGGLQLLLHLLFH